MAPVLQIHRCVQVRRAVVVKQAAEKAGTGCRIKNKAGGVWHSAGIYLRYFILLGHGRAMQRGNIRFGL